MALAVSVAPAAGEGLAAGERVALGDAPGTAVSVGGARTVGGPEVAEASGSAALACVGVCVGSATAAGWVAVSSGGGAVGGIIT